MQSNTAKILEQMNYEEVEPYLISYFIISFEERRKLMKQTPQDQKWYVIEKVSKGTDETFHNFLKALQESQDDANHELMIHLQQANGKTGQSTPWCQSEMLNTLSNSMQNELVFGEIPIPSSLTLKNCKTERSSSYTSTHTVHSGLPNTEPLITASPNLPAESQNFPTPPPPLSASDPQEDWVIVYAHTDITYFKNLTLLMEYICDKVMKSLTGSDSKSVQQIHDNISVSVKLAKAVYLAADPKTATSETRAADEQIRCSYNLLMTILHRLQKTSHSGINIDLDPILQRIGYSTDKAVLTECSVENLIIAVEELKQPKTPCVIL